MIPKLVQSSTELEELLGSWREAGLSWALVPTMGALHPGHGALVQEASRNYDRVVVSVFVNPLQFGTGEDFDTYPRHIERDLDFLADYPADVVFAPEVSDIYPTGPEGHRRLSAGPVGDTFEGASRPGHFDGVLTVVHRLCTLVRPAGIIFGAKDAQQLFLVRAMLVDHFPDVKVHEVETVRDEDGLALSSRNSYLSEQERHHAQAIPRALAAAARQPTPALAKSAALGELQREDGCTIDYVELVDPESFRPLGTKTGFDKARLIIAAKVGTTRLIDNQLLRFGQ